MNEVSADQEIGKKNYHTNIPNEFFTMYFMLTILLPIYFIIQGTILIGEKKGTREVGGREGAAI